MLQFLHSSSSFQKDEMWDPKELSDPEGKPWKKKTLSEKLNAIGIVLFKIAVLLGLLYLFVCSIGLLSDAFRLLGGMYTTTTCIYVSNYTCCQQAKPPVLHFVRAKS